MDNHISRSSQSSSTLDDQYFSSYEDIEIHRLMIKDEPRTKAFKDAILGNEHLFRDKIVMDVGAGTGILSLFAAKAGAKKVYAVEASKMSEYIPMVAQENGYENIIHVIHSKIEDVSLPTDEKVDIIISEWMGFYLLHESMLSSVLYARDHFLHDEGTLFPTNVRLFACPCSFEDYFMDHFYFWENVQGFRMSAIKHGAHRNKQTRPDIHTVCAKDLLAEPVCIKEMNLLYITESDIESFSCTSFVGVIKPGNYQALALWFDCEFDGKTYSEDGEEFGNVVSLSTSPFSPVTHWKQTVIVLGGLRKNNLSTDQSRHDSPKISKVDFEDQIVLSEMIEDNTTDSSINVDNDFLVEKDEVIGWKLDFCRSEGDRRHYNIVMESLDPEEVDHPIPCVCPMPRCVIIAKMVDREEDALLDEEQNGS